MAYQRQKKQRSSEQRKPMEPIKVDVCKVTRARRWQDGNETFDLLLNGVTIYSCRLVDGKNGTFVSFPARKGSDGQYYSHAYAPLDDETVASICQQVDELLDQSAEQ